MNPQSLHMYSLINLHRNITEFRERPTPCIIVRETAKGKITRNNAIFQFCHVN